MDDLMAEIDREFYGTCRIWCCYETAQPGELCKMHQRPPDPDLERESEREAGYRRIG